MDVKPILFRGAFAQDQCLSPLIIDLGRFYDEPCSRLVKDMPKQEDKVDPLKFFLHIS